MQSAVTEFEKTQTSVEDQKQTPVDIALLGSMACMAAAATLAWVATDTPFIQNIEDDGSAATLIVDGTFGAVAAMISMVSAEE